MPDRHRRSIRLQDYDYTQAGAYFVTTCTFQRAHLFGTVIDGTMLLNDTGVLVQHEWAQTAMLRDYVELDAFVVMPNHFHGIIVITEDLQGMRPHAPTTDPARRQFAKPIAKSLSSMIAAFKAGLPRALKLRSGSIERPIWHRNFYEHIIRSEAELNRIRDYIEHNPARWREDRFYLE